MFKNSRLTKVIFYVLAFAATVLSSLYITQAYSRPYVPLPSFLEIKAVFPFILIAIYLFLIPALLLSNTRAVYKIVLFTMIIPMFCASAWVTLDTESLLDSVQVEDHRYNLVVVHTIGDNHTTCLLYECNSNDLECKEIRSYVGNCWSLEKAELAVNPSTNEINVFLDDEWTDDLSLDFTYGSQPRSYMDKLELAYYDYYLAYFHESDTRHTPFTYMLYRCEKDSTDCTRLPFRYDFGRLPTGYLELDEQGRDIKVLIQNELVYTYGSSPKCHVEGCFLTDK